MNCNQRDLFQSRKSHRKFDRNQPVSLDRLDQIFQDALRAPSWANTQPWEIYVATGDTLEALRTAYLAAYDRSEPAAPEVPIPAEWPDALQDRSRRNGILMFENAGIAREDQKAREANWRNNFQFFEAPVLAVLCQDRSLTDWSTMDLGTFAGYLLLAAEHYGVQSVPAFSSVAYPNLLREALGIPDHLLIRAGIVLGYALAGHPYNKHVSEREPLHSLVHYKS